MKLLIYSWAEFDNPTITGGGVSVYLKRIIPELINQGVEVVFLHVGSDASDEMHIEPTDNCFADQGVASYGLFNSAVPYPHKLAFGAPELLDNKPLIEMIYGFIKQQAPDVVNFHSIEGMPAAVLRLKTQFPQMKWWFTAHNYHLVCQQIQLFQKERNRNCDDFLNGHACRTCQWQDFDNVSFQGILEHRAPWIKPLIKLPTLLKEKFARMSPALPAPPARERLGDAWLTKRPTASAGYFAQWREYNIGTVAECLDGVFAVSAMQKKLLTQQGIDEQKIHVLNPAVSAQNFEKPIPKDKIITDLSYWGYSNPGTGLSLFLDSLEVLAHRHPKASSINVLIVSDTGRRFRDRLALLEPHFNKIELIRRYDQSNMEKIAATTDLAVIGPILQETYCQVAAELYFLGVPVLASSTLGFAGEHIRDEQFIFESGSQSDLVKHLINLIDHPQALASYWQTTSAPEILSHHVSELIGLYSGSASTPTSQGAADE